MLAYQSPNRREVKHFVLPFLVLHLRPERVKAPRPTQRPLPHIFLCGTHAIFREAINMTALLEIIIALSKATEDRYPGPGVLVMWNAQSALQTSMPWWGSGVARSGGRA